MSSMMVPSRDDDNGNKCVLCQAPIPERHKLCEECQKHIDCCGLEKL